MHDKQILPISLESFPINSRLLQAPKTLKDYIKQFQEHNKKLQLDIQHDNTKSKFKGFISCFIADIIGFSAALLTIIIILVVIYIVTGHSKPKTLVANIALQCTQNCRGSSPQPHVMLFVKMVL